MLTNLQVKALKPAATRYLKTDERGLCIDVLPSGVKSWIFRYRLNGRQQKNHLGQYPAMSLADARTERDRQAMLVKDGKSPAEEKRKKKLQTKGGTPTNPTVRQFCDTYYRDQVEGKLKDPAQVLRYIDKEICPLLGDKLLRDVTVTDIHDLLYRKRDEGKVGKRDEGKVRTALHLRGTLKRIWDYGVEMRLVDSNPAQLVKAKYIGKTRARTRALSPKELRMVLRTIDDSNLMRQFKLAFRIILLTMVRKGELLQARWEHVDLSACEWTIPAELTKMHKPHVVYLAPQIIEAFRELRILSCGSDFVLPGRDSEQRHMHENSLNTALDRLTFEGVPQFTIHDMRRTSSTLLNGNGFNSDWIEAALGHAIAGVRGVYNTHDYAADRKRMLQWWADYVDATVDGGKVLVGNFAS
jgi:integrase